jgi:hypothetical protein
MRIAQKLLISDKATFEQLTTTEQNLWTRFKTADIYRFLTGEEDTVPEFQYNWISVPKLQPLDPGITGTAPPATNTALPVAPPALPPAPASPPDTGSSASTTSSTPHSLPTPSTSGTRPSGTTPPSCAMKTHNLRQRPKVDLNTGALQFGRDQFQKKC